jgi:Zn-dependent M28 family amino/carboxypeptidase
LRLISFGSEEAALRGSTAYARKHKQKLLQENAILFNLDSIKDSKQLTVVPSEINTLVFYDKKNVALAEDAFKATNTTYKKLPLGVGATDASAFHIEGLAAISVIGMESERLDPCYHTRLDTIDGVEIEALEAMKKVLINFIETWDKKNI